MGKEFNFGKIRIEFTDEFLLYNDMKKLFSGLADDAYNNFKGKYNESCANIEDVHCKALDIGYNIISSKIDKAIEILISKDLMHIDKDTFIDKYYSEYISWEEDFEEVDVRYRRIVLSSDQEKEYRDARKDSRGMWQGGGFGIGGALSGAMKAGAMNMATGAAHSIFNSVGNAMTTATANAQKDELFKDPSTLDDLAIGIWANVYTIHYALVDALRNNGNNEVSEYIDDARENKATALFNNLKKGLIPTEKQKGIIEEIIYNNPYNKDIYIYLLENYGDRDCGIVDITTLLDISVEEDKKKIIDNYFNSLAIATEEETFDSIEKFKEFADSLNITAIQGYLDKFQDILKVHDVNIRTVDNILFDTRDEAALAREEYNEIISIRNKITTNSEESISAAINAIINNDYKTVVKERHLEELNKNLIEAIRFADQLFLNDNYSVNSVDSEDVADKLIEELQGTTLRNMDLLEKRLVELKDKRDSIIEQKDRDFVENHFATVVLLNRDDITREIEIIRSLNIRTERVKEEKVAYIESNADKIMKKHNELLERAKKYEIRINTVKVEKKPESKGVFGFISKAIEKGSNFIDGIQEKKEKEAWDFITNNGTRPIE